MVVLAHLSDLHATSVRVERAADFASKRLLGLVSWRLRRGRAHRPEVLDALVADLRAHPPDHVAVTGDLTNVSCPHEFAEARAWLERLGSPERVSVVPGNHDAYVPVPRARSWALWSDYMASDEGSGGEVFPALRVRGPLALVGVCTAVATPPFFATGAIGAAQLERLEATLTRLADTPLCRVVLLHHPVTEGAVSSRRALRDAPALRAVLARAGADLVLHGHGHRSMHGRVEGPHGSPIPVVGVRSSSDVGHHADKRAQYHLYEIEPREGAGPRFRIRARIRGYEPAGGSFGDEGELPL